MSEQKEELAVDSGNSSEENSALATGASELEKTLNETDSKTVEINIDGQSSSQEVRYLAIEDHILEFKSL